MSVKSNVKGMKKNQIDLDSIEQLNTVFDLGFKKDGIFPKKLPIMMLIKNNSREIGSL